MSKLTVMSPRSPSRTFTQDFLDGQQRRARWSEMQELRERLNRMRKLVREVEDDLYGREMEWKAEVMECRLLQPAKRKGGL